MMSTTAREDRIGELLRHLARGGHTEKEVVKIERAIAELRASESREQEWLRLTQAPIQPRWRHADPW
jgi:hypothetical protein